MPEDKTPTKPKHSGLFIETCGRVGHFSVFKDEFIEVPNSKRKVKKPGLKLTTVWGQKTPGFFHVKVMMRSEDIHIAKERWGDDWFNCLCDELVELGKSNGLVEIADTPEALKAFQESQRPEGVQVTGARDVSGKHGPGPAPMVVNVTAIN